MIHTPGARHTQKFLRGTEDIRWFSWQNSLFCCHISITSLWCRWRFLWTKGKKATATETSPDWLKPRWFCPLLQTLSPKAFWWVLISRGENPGCRCYWPSVSRWRELTASSPDGRYKTSWEYHAHWQWNQVHTILEFVFYNLYFPSNLWRKVRYIQN